MTKSIEQELDQALSDLADGRASEQDLARLAQAWERNPALRREWQTLHLIGDALRAPELDPPVQSTEALLSGLREQLAREPVSLQRHRQQTRRWRDLLPALAVAAGFVLVAVMVPGGLHLPAPGRVQQQAAAPRDDGLANALVAPSPSSMLNGDPSFVQTIVPTPTPSQAQPQLRGWPHDAGASATGVGRAARASGSSAASSASSSPDF